MNKQNGSADLGFSIGVISALKGAILSFIGAIPAIFKLGTVFPSKRQTLTFLHFTF